MRCRKLLFIAYGIMMVWVLVLSGCGNDSPKDLRQYVDDFRREADTRARQAVVKPPMVDKKSTYRAHHLRVPFAAEGGGQGQIKTMHIDPLQRYSLSVLRFVGTWTQDGMTKGYIVTPDGMVYGVSVGDELGDNQGRISAITPQQITIVEQTAEGQSAIHTLRLREGEE